MVRFMIIGIIVAVAFTLYALVDAAMTDGARARGVSKPVWVVLIVVLPVIGGILWFMIGKGDASAAPKRTAPDDDPRFSGTKMSNDDLDAHMRDLEARLRELDDEVFPGERPGGAGADARGRGAGGGSAAETGTPGDAGSTGETNEKNEQSNGDDEGSGSSARGEHS